MTRAELEEQRRFLLDSLRDLEREHQAGEIDDGDYESLRDDYTARAADVLRALEDHDRAGGEDPPASPDPLDPPAGPRRRGAPTRPGPGGRPAARPAARPSTRPTAGSHTESRHSRARRITAIALIVGFVAVAGASVLVMAGGREPGTSATGSVPRTVEGKIALAHQLESQGEALEALKLYDDVLRTDPTNPEALTYRGWLFRLAGLVDEAQASLDRAVASDPAYPDARFFRGILLFRDRQDPAAAIPEFEAYLAANPPAETVDAVRGVLEEARRAVAAPATTAPPAP